MELFLILLRQEENVLGEVCGDCFLDKLNLDNIWETKVSLFLS